MNKKGGAGFSLEQVGWLVFLLAAVIITLYLLYRSGIISSSAVDTMKFGGGSDSVPLILGIRKWK